MRAVVLRDAIDAARKSLGQPHVVHPAKAS
jgi:hypothetical protein